MAVNRSNYHYNQNSALFSLEDDDVDDDLFLKNSRKPQNSQNSHASSQIAQLQARRDNVENNTLASTQRSLSLLRESEQVGVATAQELAAQREQLERTSKNLDAINATLRTTQRNINGIKSVFSSLKNYLTGPKETNVTSSKSEVSETKPEPSSSPQPSRFDGHQQEPVGVTPTTHTTQTTQRPATVQAAIDQNLCLMADNIGNLRGLALNLGDEILDQNQLLDSMQYKADNVDITMQRQNVQMNRLLGKK